MDEQMKPTPSRRAKALKVCLICAAVLVLIAVIGGVLYYVSMVNKMNHVEVPELQYTEAPTEVPAEVPTAETTEAATEATEPPHIPSSEDYINILLVGQAARHGETERFADTMILCTLNTYEKTITLTSILRDTLIGMSGPYRNHYWGNIKITTVYHMGYIWGGTAGSMACINQTLYDNFGIEVDHNFEVDFDAFVTAIDLLGGVELELTEAEADYLNKEDGWVRYDVEPGLQKLDGMATLCYARMRKAEGDGESDIRRTSRQRYLMSVLLDKAKDMSPKKLQKMADKVLPYVTTSMDTAEITELLLKVLPMLPDLEIKASGTCPAEYSGALVDIYKNGFEHSVLKFVPSTTKKAMRAITEGEITE